MKVCALPSPVSRVARILTLWSAFFLSGWIAMSLYHGFLESIGNWNEPLRTPIWAVPLWLTISLVGSLCYRKSSTWVLGAMTCQLACLVTFGTILLSNWKPMGVEASPPPLAFVEAGIVAVFLTVVWVPLLVGMLWIQRKTEDRNA